MSAETPEEVPADAPGSGENICRRCEGSGRADGVECPDCKGTGRIVTPIGGG